MYLCPSGPFVDPSQWTVRDETQDHPGRRKNSGFFQPIKHLSGQTETAAQKPLHYREKRGVWKRKSWNWFDRIPVQFTSTQTVPQIAASEFGGKKGRGREGGKNRRFPHSRLRAMGKRKVVARKEGMQLSNCIGCCCREEGKEQCVCIVRFLSQPHGTGRGDFF